MAGPVQASTEKGYAALFNAAYIVPKREDDARKLARKMLASKVRYKEIERLTGVPWHMAAALHMRESDMNFRTHLHCGDSLNARTYHVPKGRPKAPPQSGALPYTFEESAVDALTMPGKEFDKVKDWTLELQLFDSEGYNGWGYLRRGNSPYIWAWTNQYTSGKYVADHVYSETAVDTQPGVVAMFKALAAIDDDTARSISHRAGNVPLPKSAIDKHTRKERGSAAGGAAGSAAGAGTKAGTEQPTGEGAQFVHSVGTWVLIGVGVAVAIVAVALLMRKTQIMREKWGVLTAAQ